MNIKLIKLVTGEEVICEYKEGNRHVVLENPMVIMAMNTDDGVSIGMAPWMPAAKDRKFKVSQTQHIVTVVDPATELGNQYNEHFGTGIVVPDKTEQSIIV